MKRYLIALAGAAFVGSTVLASAAALDVSGGVAQTGTLSVDDLTCDTDGILVQQLWDTDDPVPSSYRPQYYNVDLTACEGEYIVAVAYDDAGNALGKSVRQVPASAEGHDDPGNGDYFRGPSWTNGVIPIADIDHVNVTIIS